MRGLLAAGALLALSSTPRPPLQAAGPGEVVRAVLANGLTVLLLEDRSSPLVSVGMMYRVGARNESAGTTGLAHYVEHMNFRATRGFPGNEVTERVTRIGGRSNGYTWIDQTYYAETVPRDGLDLVLEIEADRMVNALHDPEDFRKERTSVIAELHSYEDPDSLLYDAVLAASYEIHPYRNNTIGWLSDVEAVTRDDAYGFYRRFYHPGNAVLAVVGDMDAQDVLAKVRERFGTIPGAGQATEIRTLEPPQTGQRRVVVRKPGTQARIVLAFRAPALADPDFPAMVLFDALLAGGKGFYFTRDYAAPATTPLRRATVEPGLATKVGSRWQASRYPYVYTVAASAPGERELPALESALFQALADAGARDWSDGEIRAALRQVRTGWAVDLDDTAGRAHQLAFFEVSGGSSYLVDLPERLSRVTREDLRRFARERLQPHQATVGWFVPAAEAVPPATAAVPSRAAEDAPAEAGPPRLPIPAAPAVPTAFALESGVRVVLAPVRGAGVVALRVRVDAGSLHDGGAGISALAAERLSRPLPGEETASPALEWTLHEEPDTSVNFRWIEFHGAALAEDLPQLLAAVTRRLGPDRAPVGPDTWEELRRAALERSRELDTSSRTALWRRALAEVFPAGSPLASPAWGSADALARLSSQALDAFLRDYVTPSRTTLVLAGALDPQAVRRQLRQSLGGRAGPKPLVASLTARAAPRTEWTEVTLPHPGSAQNDLLVVWPGDRGKPWDQAATDVLLYLLGETGYAGRLGRALVDPGLVYSVYATLEEEGAPGLLTVRTAAAPKNTKEVLRRIRSVLEEAAKGAFTQKDLDEARTYLRGKAAREREGTARTAAALMREAVDTTRRATSELTLEQLNDTARRLFGNGAPLGLVAGPGY